MDIGYFTLHLLNMRVIIILFFPLICHGLVNKIIEDVKFRFLGGKGVAEELDPLELLAITAQGPRLPQSGAMRSCGLADEAVHAAIETIRDTAPLEEACLDIPSLPIHARTGQF